MVGTPFQSLKLRPAQAAIALAAGAGIAVSGCLWGPSGYAWAGTVLAFALSWAALVDVDRFILPNSLTLGLAACGLVLAARQGVPQFLDHAAGTVLGYGVLAVVAFAYRRLRGREGLGLGDAKLMAAAGAWLGWAALPSVLLAASFAGIVWVALSAVATRQFLASHAVPFGPFIGTGFWIVWLFGPVGGYPYGTFAL
jgi:leader peptidase (prepilin peptidase) / N-methyltransferase